MKATCTSLRCVKDRNTFFEGQFYPSDNLTKWRQMKKVRTRKQRENSGEKPIYSHLVWKKQIKIKTRHLSQAALQSTEKCQQRKVPDNNVLQKPKSSMLRRKYWWRRLHRIRCVIQPGREKLPTVLPSWPGKVHSLLQPRHTCYITNHFLNGCEAHSTKWNSCLTMLKESKPHGLMGQRPRKNLILLFCWVD